MPFQSELETEFHVTNQQTFEVTKILSICDVFVCIYPHDRNKTAMTSLHRRHMSLRLLVIHNPVAGRRRRIKLKRFLKLLTSRGHRFELSVTTQAGDARRAARSTENFDIIVAAGGDGTVNEVPRSGQLVGDTNRSDCSGCNVSRFEGQTRFAIRGRWSTEPDVGRVAHGVSGRVDRLKQLGNAVVPQIPELIGRAIMEYDRG